MTAPAPPLASGTRTTSGRPSPFLLSSLDVQVPVAAVRKDPGRGHGEGLEGGLMEELWIHQLKGKRRKVMSFFFFFNNKEFEEVEKMNEGGMEREQLRGRLEFTQTLANRDACP